MGRACSTTGGESLFWLEIGMMLSGQAENRVVDIPVSEDFVKKATSPAICCSTIQVNGEGLRTCPLLNTRCEFRAHFFHVFHQTNRLNKVSHHPQSRLTGGTIQILK